MLHRTLAVGLFAAASYAASLTVQQDRPIPADTDIITTTSGLKYSVLSKGDGTTKAKAGDKVKVHYTGWLPTTGKIFDSSLRAGQPFEFVLGRRKVIEGWDEGVALMSRGDRFKFTIQPERAYGANGAPPTIPPNATLVFEVELLDVVPGPEFRPGNKQAQKKTESGLVYEVLVEGKGELPKEDDVLTVKFALWRANGESEHSTEMDEANVPRKGTVDVLAWPIFAESAKLMKVGSRYRFEADATASLGKEMAARARIDGTLVWEVEFVDAKPSNVPKFVMPADAALKTTPTGLKYEVVKEGTGKKPGPTDTVTVHYAGWLTDGTRFDSSYGRGDAAPMSLSRVIPGWREGVQLMGEGAVYKFVIPGELAYGPRGSPPKIGPNATLVFQIELVKVGQ
ncbi:MAG: FKBP-type peptidyl-prolyl cis-trans isomerase [Planctomycetes bacterium]|nr:FKBP-type peptidyl-prolyl cis-trans isomerase [Planctomycetota bacterium]